MLNRRRVLAGGAAAWLASDLHAADLPSKPLERLQRALGDRLAVAGQATYEAARVGTPRNPLTDRRPLAVAQCVNRDDVVRTLEFAHESHLPLAVRSGGCDVLGESVCDGGILLDVSAISEVAVEAAPGRANVGGGVRSAALSAIAGQVGLAPVLGCNPIVGVSGLTLGGGLGWLAGTHGAACDNLLAAEVVTADGRVRKVDGRTEPDLFWALRGGGGNFGVVTQLTLRLHPIDQVLAGVIGFRTDPARFLGFYKDFMADAPNALTVELSMSGGPTPTVLALCCWTGDPETGGRWLRPLRAYGRPLFDRVAPVRYGAFAQAGAPPAGGHLIWRGGSFDALTEAALDVLAEAVARAPPAGSIGLGHRIHGAACGPAANSTAFARRPGQFSYFVGAGWPAGATDAAARDWIDASSSALQHVASRQPYLNYLSDDAEAAVRAAYGEDRYRRLAALKRRYDPENIFHLNRNIRPGGMASAQASHAPARG